jgi:hypothetical protein
MAVFLDGSFAKHLLQAILCRSGRGLDREEYCEGLSVERLVAPAED